MDEYCIARVKKPHRKFNVGDIVIGSAQDGQAERLVCYGWSSKLHVLMRRYSMCYQGWTGWVDSNREYHSKCTGSGHLAVIKWFESDHDWYDLIELLDEPIADFDGFIRQLSLFGENVSEMVRVAAAHPCMRP